MRQRLFHEILMARQRVYEIGEATPLECVALSDSIDVHLKREDLSVIHAYKWRGAYNRMSMLEPDERERGIVAASAGNHAQGVALAAKRLGIRARIYMPVATPRMKQIAVHRHGTGAVEVILHGDNYDAAAERALRDVKESKSAFIHPYDDLGTMGGQGTLADEVVMAGEQPFDVAYLQIGGGGLAASVACWLKTFYPNIRIVGVEGVDQASMAAAIRAGKPVSLDYVDVFADGTAVKKVGELTYALCAELVDEFITVTNEELCAAIQFLWEKRRCIPEPAGAMGLAGLMKQQDELAGARALCIVAGSNMDFGQLAWVARHAGIGGAQRRYFRIELPERPGALLDLLDAAMDGINISEIQYGKVHETRAWPVIAFEASPMELEVFDRKLDELGFAHEDVTSTADVEFRIIHYESALFKNPLFIVLEFPERPGALHDFLKLLHGVASLCYFNYSYTGEQVGRAMVGFEFDSEDNRNEFKKILRDSHHDYTEVARPVLNRML